MSVDNGKKSSVRVRAYINSHQGLRQYMEDFVRVVVDDKSGTDNSPVYYLGVFDGHGGPEAARLAQNYLFADIARRIGDWGVSDDTAVVEAIKSAFNSTHEMMKQYIGSWPKAACGLPSTSGTTASLVIIYGNKMYVANVGDSTVVLGQVSKCPAKSNGSVSSAGQTRLYTPWSAVCLTKDHKPDCPQERQRIEEHGGRVIKKSGVPRVVWKRVRHNVPPGSSIDNWGDHIAIRTENIPFLAVARSLGDLWSYNEEHKAYVVSPVPDITVHDLNVESHRCVVLASDGVWNVVSSADSIQAVQHCVQRYKRERNAEQYHPAQRLVQLAIDRWDNGGMRADNTSAIVAVLLYDDEAELGLQEEMCHPDAVQDFSSDQKTQKRITDRILHDSNTSSWSTFIDSTKPGSVESLTDDMNDNRTFVENGLGGGKRSQDKDEPGGDSCITATSPDSQHSQVDVEDLCTDALENKVKEGGSDILQSGIESAGNVMSLDRDKNDNVSSKNDSYAGDMAPSVDREREISVETCCDTVMSNVEVSHTEALSAPQSVPTLSDANKQIISTSKLESNCCSSLSKLLDLAPTCHRDMNSMVKNTNDTSAVEMTVELQGSSVSTSKVFNCCDFDAETKHKGFDSNDACEVSAISFHATASDAQCHTTCSVAAINNLTSDVSMISSASTGLTLPAACYTTPSLSTPAAGSLTGSTSDFNDPTSAAVTAVTDNEALSPCDIVPSFKRKADDTAMETSSCGPCRVVGRQKKTTAAATAAGLVDRPAIAAVNHLTRYHIQQIHVKQA